jgi:hypothetical protein
MKKTNTVTVTPKVGYYLVRTVGPQGVDTHLVGKDKHCTCGGHARRRCRHIRAVAEYLKAGGERAPKADKGDRVQDSKPATERRKRSPEIPETCPVCGGEIQPIGHRAWRCVDDSAHYYQWRGELNGGAIRKFLTQPHPAKQGAFYEMTEEERDAFLVLVGKRMLTTGYTPHSLGGNGHE